MVLCFRLHAQNSRCFGKKNQKKTVKLEMNRFLQVAEKHQLSSAVPVFHGAKEKCLTLNSTISNMLPTTENISSVHGVKRHKKGRYCSGIVNQCARITLKHAHTLPIQQIFLTFNANAHQASCFRRFMLNSTNKMYE